MRDKFGVMPGEYPAGSSDDPKYGEILPPGKAGHANTAEDFDFSPEDAAILKDLFRKGRLEELQQTLETDYSLSADEAADVIYGMRQEMAGHGPSSLNNETRSKPRSEGVPVDFRKPANGDSLQSSSERMGLQKAADKAFRGQSRAGRRGGQKPRYKEKRPHGEVSI